MSQATSKPTLSRATTPCLFFCVHHQNNANYCSHSVQKNIFAQLFLPKLLFCFLSTAITRIFTALTKMKATFVADMMNLTQKGAQQTGWLMLDLVLFLNLSLTNEDPSPLRCLPLAFVHVGFIANDAQMSCLENASPCNSGVIEVQ